MKIAVIGVSHQSTPIAIREKLALTDSEKVSLLDEMMNEEVAEAVILSTCNRSEIYLVAQDLAASTKDLVQKLQAKCEVEELAQYLFTLEGKAAIAHLFQVAAGLDSLVVGEDQILGQVKDAHDFAMAVGATGKVLNKCFREAITTAKKIKSNLAISHYPLSITSIGMKYMKEKMGHLTGKSVLLIGMGKMNQLALNYLLEEQVETIYVANRTRHKVATWQEKYPEVEVIPYEQLHDYLVEVDLVISATASPHLILKREKMPRLQKELYILDMALPRDVDPALEEIAGVHLYNIDALSQISYENSVKRNQLAKQAEQFITEGIEGFYKWAKTIPVDPTIHSLQERCDQIQADTMVYLKRKLALDCKEEKLIEKMLMSAMHRLMREPINKLKEIDETTKQQAYIEVLEDLFDL